MKKTSRERGSEVRREERARQNSVSRSLELGTFGLRFERHLKCAGARLSHEAVSLETSRCVSESN